MSSWKRYNEFDFGTQIRVEKDGRLYLKVLPEDELPGVLHFEIATHKRWYVSILMVKDAPEESYSDGEQVFVPKRIWKAAQEWADLARL